MNQELMTLDFWQDTVIYEGKTLPVGALACDALNVPADTIAKMNEQCEKINLLLGMLMPDRILLHSFQWQRKLH